MSSPRLSLVKLLTELGLVENPPHESLIESRNECPLLLLSKLGQLSEADALQRLSKHLGIEQWDLDTGDYRHVDPNSPWLRNDPEG